MTSLDYGKGVEFHGHFEVVNGASLEFVPDPLPEETISLITVDSALANKDI